MNVFNLPVSRVYLEIIKNPEVIKKNGTATRATTRVNIKSLVSLTDDKGEVWIVITNIAAANRK